MQIKWKRWVVGSAGVLAAYSGVGFWLVPQLIQSALPKIGQTVLERQASIGAVSFNPYTLRLEASDLRLAEANGAPLISIAQLAVELQWRSLARRAWALAEVRIVAPDLLLAIAPDGKFNLAELLATLNRRPHDDQDQGMPRLMIDHFALERGKLALHDRRAGFSDTYAPIDLTLKNLSTLPDQNGDYTFSADAAGGGKLHWRGVTTLNPIAGAGELVLEKVALPGLAAYLKPYTRATVSGGTLSAKLPYRYTYANGKFDASLTGAGLALKELAVTGGGAPFATLKQLELAGVDADLMHRAATVGKLTVAGGQFSFRRKADGQFDLADLQVPGTKPSAAPANAGTPKPWKLALKQVDFDQLAFNAVDEMATPPLKLSMDQVQLHLQMQAEQATSGLQLTVGQAAFSLANLTLTSGNQTPFKLAQLGFTDGAVDLAKHQMHAGRLFADGGQLLLERDSKGQFTILSRLPKARRTTPGPVSADAAASGAPWVARADNVDFNKFGALYDDQSTGIKATVQDFNLKLDGASSDTRQPLKFTTGLTLREGGQLAAHGTLIPATSALDAELQIKQLALAPVQPLLGKYLKLKIASGGITTQGRLISKPGTGKDNSLLYVGGFDLAGLRLNEDDGDLFASWKSVRTDKLTLGLAPDMLDIPELRIVEPNAKLIIENDRSFNASRLLVQAADGARTVLAPPKSAAAKPAFPVHIQRVRLQNAKLDFTDLSLRPQFSAKIYELSGVVTGLSSKRDARSQIELDGRVDEFGLARVRGQLNPFAASENTDLNVIFKNVDMVSASPYTMKFAGYKIAEGKISLDLQYKVRHNQLDGNNHIVFDQLTLGERIDSPDALKLPLELALAILKDSDGRIDLGLPVAGDLNDPQFSYGSVVWKAMGNVLTKIVSAPFRALGNLLGISGEQLEAISFDPGSATLLPPERAKLQQVAQILAKRGQLTLSVPGQYSTVADGAALRAGVLRREIAKRAGIKLESGEEPGPLDMKGRAVRSALRSLYGERFGSSALEQQKKAAETAAASAAPVDTTAKDEKTVTPHTKLAVWQRLGKLIQGEPQVADAGPFYSQLQERLEQQQPLAADALPKLGAQRASAIVAVLGEAGVAPVSARTMAPEAIGSGAGQPVHLKLGLTTK